MSRRAGATTFATFAILAEVILAGVSCGGGAAPAAHPAPDAGGGGPPATGPTGATTSDAATSLDALAARGPTDAPLMREILRVERAAPSAALPRAERDICVRAIFAASREVRVWFADESGTMRGEPATGASGTDVPACYAK